MGKVAIADDNKPQADNDNVKGAPAALPLQPLLSALVRSFAPRFDDMSHEVDVKEFVTDGAFVFGSLHVVAVKSTALSAFH
jgi:hypothetical protein